MKLNKTEIKYFKVLMEFASNGMNKTQAYLKVYECGYNTARNNGPRVFKAIYKHRMYKLWKRITEFDNLGHLTYLNKVEPTPEERQDFEAMREQAFGSEVL